MTMEELQKENEELKKEIAELQCIICDHNRLGAYNYIGPPPDLRYVESNCNENSHYCVQCGMICDHLVWKKKCYGCGLDVILNATKEDIRIAIEKDETLRVLSRSTVMEK